MYLLLNLVPDFHRLISDNITIVLSKFKLLLSNPLCTLRQLRNWCKIIVRRQMPEEGRGYPDSRPFWELSLPVPQSLDRGEGVGV